MDTTEIDAITRAAVAGAEASSIAWLVAVDGEVHIGTAGHVDADPSRPTQADTIFRISSMSKPITAVAALQLIDGGAIALDDPVDRLLPELADRRVLADPQGPIDRTVPAERPITVRDLLTFRMGLGIDFTGAGPQPSLGRLAELGLPPGPPRPQDAPPPDEWLALIGSVPLEHQPGARWLYHTSADALGVLVERATGRTLGEVCRTQIFEPLGMTDTGFSVPRDQLHRFGACFGALGDGGAIEIFDPAEGQWASEPRFRSGGGGLVSTLGDFHAFAAMLLNGGTHAGDRILSSGLVAEMTSNQLTEEQTATGGPAPGDAGWGFGVGVQLRTVPIRGAGAYDWDGGLGSSWANDPAAGLIGILLTDRMWSSPEPPALWGRWWAAAYRSAG